MEYANALLQHEVNALRSRVAQQSRSISLKSEIIISGLPLDHGDSHVDLARRVLTALDFRELAGHVLSARFLPKKIAFQDSFRVSASLVVVFASNSVCDAVIADKRTKRDSKRGEILGNGATSNVFVNEMLPSETYNLLCEVKARASKFKHKYVCVRDGVVHVRKADRLPVIKIHNSSEIYKLT